MTLVANWLFNGWNLAVGVYSPSANQWHEVVAPGDEIQYSSRQTWTGERLIFTGRGVSSYHPASQTWFIESPLPVAGRASHSQVWTGAEVIVWGGYNNGDHWGDGARYLPATHEWVPTSTIGAPSPRSRPNGIWTGTELLMWGGTISETNPASPGAGLSNGARYRPISDSWLAMSTSGAPPGQAYGPAVWSGTEMLLWSGWFSTNAGGRYHPSSDSWTAMTTVNAPVGRFEHNVVWSGEELIAWGGNTSTGIATTGGRYDPDSDTWLPTSTVGVPTNLAGATAVWTGNRMLLWGTAQSSPKGGSYDPASDSWSPISTVGQSARHGHSAIWTGEEMIVWGGFSHPNPPNQSGGRYDPDSDTWAETSQDGAPLSRYAHRASLIGEKMLVWGGEGFHAGDQYASYLAAGGEYCIPTGFIFDDGFESGDASHW